MPSCAPADLVEAAKCFICDIEPGDLEAVKVYLLATIAGGSMDPQVLVSASKCYDCLTPGELKNVELYLLCSIANA